MTSEELGEMFEGDSADTCTGKFPVVSMGGQAEGLFFLCSKYVFLVMCMNLIHKFICTMYFDFFCFSSHNKAPKSHKIL